MSLADERRAIRENVAATRAPTAGAQRRAIGQRLEAERRGAQVVEDLQRLQRTPQQRRTLRTVPPVGAVPATRGRGNYTPPPATGGGIASPLVEQPGTRELYDAETFVSIDGLLAFRVRRVKAINMLDANGAEVVMEFANVP